MCCSCRDELTLYLNHGTLYRFLQCFGNKADVCSFIKEYVYIQWFLHFSKALFCEKVFCRKIKMLQFLNDDCLLKIFQYLGLREQLKLALLDERFRPLIVERTWRKFHIFKHFPSFMLTFREYRKLFYLVAPHITELTLDEQFEDFCYTTPKHDFYFCIEYPQLRKLYLRDDFPDYFMRLARNCPKLELLEVNCWSFTWESLCQFPNLQTLSLSTLDTLDPIYLEKVFEKQKITHVQLGIEPTNIKDLNKVLKPIFPKITKLSYIDEFDDWDLGNLFNSSTHLFQNLEVLHVLECKERSIDFVCSLHSLRVLHLETSYMQMEDLLKVIDNNVHLEHLHLYSGLMHGNDSNLEEQCFTGEGVCKLSDLRRQQQKNEPSKRLLNIHIYKSLVKDLQHFVKDHDTNHEYQEPAIKIVEQPVLDYEDEDEEPKRYSLDFMLTWN